MRIIWNTWETTPDAWAFGHGVHFHDCRKPSDHSLVAWLEGYEWLHGNPKVVPVWCIAPDSITTEDVLTAMREAITTHLKKKKVPSERISPHIDAIMNG